ncbi:MAG TPA: hypothetical protein VF092_06455 [Longimicrobium sp.]
MTVTIGIMLAKAKLAAETFQLIKSFVVDEMTGVLVEMGDVQLRAAITASNDARLSEKPEREVAIVIGHLQSAREAFRRTAEVESQRFFSNCNFSELKQKQIACLLLITMCYAYLRSRNLLEHYAAALQEAYVELCQARYSVGPDRLSYEEVKEMDEGEEALIALFHSLSLPGWEPNRWLARLEAARRDAELHEDEPWDWRTSYY